MNYYKWAADRNHVHALYIYGDYKEKIGEGEEAMMYYKMAADKGHDEAAFCYGKNSFTIKYVDVDKNEGYIYLHESYFKNAQLFLKIEISHYYGEKI